MEMHGGHPVKIWTVLEGFGEKVDLSSDPRISKSLAKRTEHGNLPSRNSRKTTYAVEAG